VYDESRLYRVISLAEDPSGKEFSGIDVKFNAVPGLACMDGSISSSLLIRNTRLLGVAPVA